MRLAITHDYLRDVRGGEKMVEAMHQVWPDSPIYTSIIDRPKLLSQGWDFSGQKIITSWLQRIWWPLRNILPRFYFTLLFPLAFMSFDFADFDVVISSSSYAAKDIRKGRALHISYIHTPPRFLWGFDT